MELKDIVSISGKSGLYKIIKPTRMGFVLESLDGDKRKLVTNPRQKVSVLEEISIYTKDTDGSHPLKEVLSKMFTEFHNNLEVTPGSSPQEMRDFLAKVVPNFDEERVYTSDIKKLITWYSVLLDQCPEVLKTSTKTKKDASAKKGAGAKKDSAAKKDSVPATKKRASKKNKQG